MLQVILVILEVIQVERSFSIDTSELCALWSARRQVCTPRAPGADGARKKKIYASPIVSETCPPHGGGAARCWRAVDRGSDSAATPSPAARRAASSAPKQTRARGAAAAAKTSTSTSLLVSSCRRRTRARRAPVSPRSLREGRFEPGASRRGGGARRQKARRLLSLRCCWCWHLLT